MKHANATTQKISDNFERFNPYAARAQQGHEDDDIYATLAVAFELSQLRFQLTKRLDNGTQKGQGSHDGR